MHPHDGYIVVAACKDECVTKLSLKAKYWFKEMGSTEIMDLRYREGFAFIGVLGAKQALERRATEITPIAAVTQIFKLRPDHKCE